MNRREARNKLRQLGRTGYGQMLRGSYGLGLHGATHVEVGLVVAFVDLGIRATAKLAIAAGFPVLNVARLALKARRERASSMAWTRNWRDRLLFA